MIDIIRQKFTAMQEKNPSLSSFVCYVRVIRGKEYDEVDVKRGFDKLVEKDDWKGNNYAELLDYVYLENRKEMKD
jgi:hypothetical protein